uniref:Uncharacterized protein n=1 Tax=Phocoena sinus TaxID=42100 RepID=A0A8C9E391_PHOSS
MDTLMLNMRNLFEQLVRRMEILSEGNEVRNILFSLSNSCCMTLSSGINSITMIAY